MKKFRLFAAMCVLVLALGAMTACGGNSTESSAPTTESVGTDNNAGADTTTPDTTAPESTEDSAAESTPDTTTADTTADTTTGESTAE